MKTRIGLAIAAAILCANTHAAAFPFSDGFESGPGNWSLTGLWGMSSIDPQAGANSLADSPGRLYTNATDASATLANGIDLSGAIRPALAFYHHHALETGFDFGMLELATNGGPWQVAAAYTGSRYPWSREQFDLSPYTTVTNLRIRFRLTTDASVVSDGWSIDSVHIGDAPLAPTLVPITNAGPTQVRLEWTPSASSGLVSQQVLRSSDSNASWQAMQQIAVLGPGASSYTDISSAPKSHYTYRILALASTGLHAASTAASVLTPTGMDFPFLDDGEGGGGHWITEGGWTLSTEAAHSPSHAWTDSPGTNYPPSVNHALRSVAALDLRGADAPVLSFVHHYAFASGDSGNAEVSVNGGVDWASLGTFTGTQTNGWQLRQYSLMPYTNTTDLLLRFRITTDGSTPADGWHIDDIGLSSAPAQIDGPLISELASHSLRLTWATNTSSNFSHYAVYRGPSASVGLGDTLVTQIVDAATANCVVTGLAIDTEYFFRVYAVNVYGGHSPDGSYSTARTLAHPAPYTDDFNGGLEGWNLTGTWDQEAAGGPDGSGCLSDSPDANYVHNRDSSAQTAVDLRGTTWPVLRFWDRYALHEGDWFRVEISPNGSSWYPHYGRHGSCSRTNWTEQTIDLSEWKGQSNVRIRFRRLSNNDAGTVADGWLIDDLAVLDLTLPTLPYPFAESFEDAAWTSRWLTASWNSSATNGAHAGLRALADREGPFTRLGPDCQLHAEPAGEFDLTGASNPQLVFRVNGDYRSNYGRLYVYASVKAVSVRFVLLKSSVSLSRRIVASLER